MKDDDDPPLEPNTRPDSDIFDDDDDLAFDPAEDGDKDPVDAGEVPSRGLRRQAAPLQKTTDYVAHGTPALLQVRVV